MFEKPIWCVVGGLCLAVVGMFIGTMIAEGQCTWLYDPSPQGAGGDDEVNNQNQTAGHGVEGGGAGGSTPATSASGAGASAAESGAASGAAAGATESGGAAGGALGGAAGGAAGRDLDPPDALVARFSSGLSSSSTTAAAKETLRPNPFPFPVDASCLKCLSVNSMLISLF